jgi:itaconate CoA-transferase
MQPDIGTRLSESTLPLAGVRVVSIEQAVAAPLASRHLADLGAQVTKVERPDGDFARHYDSAIAGTSAFFVWCNRNKSSVAADLKQAGDLAAVAALIADADVVISNLAPGAMDRLGLGAESLLERHPELVVCEISGFGPTGPHAERKAYDLVIQAEAGLFDVTGDAERRVRVGLSIADIAAAMHALSGVLAALVQRTASGRGSVVRISMLDAMTDWMTVPMLYDRFTDRPLRTGSRHSAIAPYGVFETGDGSILIAVQNQREWSTLCDALGRPDLVSRAEYATNATRVTHVDALTAQLEAILAESTAATIESMLTGHGIACALVRSVGEVWTHPQLIANHRFQEVDVNGQAVPVPRSPFDHRAESPLARVPAVGPPVASATDPQ